jgi:hypothetical protein
MASTLRNFSSFHWACINLLSTPSVNLSLQSPVLVCNQVRLLLLPLQRLVAHSSGPLFVSVHNLVKVSIDTILAAQRLLYCTFKFFTSTQNRSPLCIEYLAHSPAQSSLGQRPNPLRHPSFRFLCHRSNVIGSQHATHVSSPLSPNFLQQTHLTICIHTSSHFQLPNTFTEQPGPHQTPILFSSFLQTYWTCHTNHKHATTCPHFSSDTFTSAQSHTHHHVHLSFTQIFLDHNQKQNSYTHSLSICFQHTRIFINTSYPTLNTPNTPQSNIIHFLSVNPTTFSLIDPSQPISPNHYTPYLSIPPLLLKFNNPLHSSLTNSRPICTSTQLTHRWLYYTTKLYTYLLKNLCPTHLASSLWSLATSYPPTAKSSLPNHSHTLSDLNIIQQYTYTTPITPLHDTLRLHLLQSNSTIHNPAIKQFLKLTHEIMIRSPTHILLFPNLTIKLQLTNPSNPRLNWYASHPCFLFWILINFVVFLLLFLPYNTRPVHAAFSRILHSTSMARTRISAKVTS